MSKKKYLMCLNCGNVQVRTDISGIISGNYIVLSKPQLSCVRCMCKKNIATNSIKALDKSLRIQSEEEKTELDYKIQYLLKV